MKDWGESSDMGHRGDLDLRLCLQVAGAAKAGVYTGSALGMVPISDGSQTATADAQ